MPNEELTDTGRKMLFNDHDILIEIRTTQAIMRQDQSDFYKKYDERHAALANRVSQLEINQASHIARTDINEEVVNRLQNRSNLWDGINSLGVAITAILAYFYKI